MMWIVEYVLRAIAFFLDRIVYSFIGVVYNILISIAETTIFTDEIIDLFASKVYALLGIFMLFKVSFSILTYIVNPDDFLDKTKGFSKLVSNILITLVLLITTPWIFSQAMDIQRIVLRDNIIGKIFAISETNNNSSLDPGQVMAYQTFKAFYYLDTEDAYPKCKGIETGSADSECQKAFGNSSDYNKFVDIFEKSETTNNVNFYLDWDLVFVKDSNGNFTMSYIPIISTIAGGVIVLLLTVFCFDIALRSIKLGFLRMIAPIPIISRIDPKKGKEVFDKWVKNCMSTYLDLFMRLLAIYFAVFVIGQVINADFTNSVTGLKSDVNVFVKVFIIIGALMFAKQLPKLLEEISGFKMDGKFTLNPLKKLSEVPLAGRTMATSLGAADSLIHGQGFMAGAARGFKNHGDGKKGIFVGMTETKALLGKKFGTNEDANKAKKSIRERDQQIAMGTKLNDEKNTIVDRIKASDEYKALENIQNSTNSNKDEIANAKIKMKRMEAEAEATMFKTPAYKTSYVELAVKKQEMYDAKNIAQQISNKHAALENRLASLSEDDPSRVSVQAQVDQAFKDLEAANSKAGKSEAIFKLAEKRHDDLKVIHTKDAEIDNAMDVAGKLK